MARLLKILDPFPTLGGKSQLLTPLIQVWNYIVNEHQITGMLDLFMGGNRLHTHFEDHHIEFKLANEIDRGVVAFFRCLQDPYKTEQLLNQIQQLADYIGEEEFEALKVVRRDPQTDEILAGALTYIAARYSRATNRQEFCQQNADRGIKIASLYKKFFVLNGVYEDVIFTQGDYEEQFHRYKQREDFMMFLDPPYCEEDSKGKTKETEGYVDKFDIKRHEGLIENLLSPEMKAKYVLCGYPNRIYDRLVASSKAFCYFIGIVHVASAATGRMRPEFIWTNVELPDYVLPVLPHDFEW